MSFAVFAVLFLALTNWFQLRILLSLGGRHKRRVTKGRDAWITKTLKVKTGLTIPEFTIHNSPQPYAMMAGMPWSPSLIISRKLYDTFTRRELDWVILHEAAHCLLWHNPLAMLLELNFLGTGAVIIYHFHTGIPAAALLALVFAVIAIQCIRWNIEYYADRFAIARVTNPEGVISAQDKFRKEPHPRGMREGSILRFLLHWNISPRTRIALAEREIEKRRNRKP